MIIYVNLSRQKKYMSTSNKTILKYFRKFYLTFFNTLKTRPWSTYLYTCNKTLLKLIASRTVKYSQTRPNYNIQL